MSFAQALDSSESSDGEPANTPDHSSEPLFVQSREDGVFFKTIPGENMLRVLDGGRQLSHANRMAACVNACRGIASHSWKRLGFRLEHSRRRAPMPNASSASAMIRLFRPARLSVSPIWAVCRTYRFSQPDEPAALMLPRSHQLNNRKQSPKELNTLGDHLLRRRLVLKLLQREVAKQIGVDKPALRTGKATGPGRV
jgi:hypothetical protein